MTGTSFLFPLFFPLQYIFFISLIFTHVKFLDSTRTETSRE